MGPATVYVGASGVITLPPTDAAVNATPAASAWTDLGGTNGGLTFDVTPKFTDFSLDQTVVAPGSRLTSQTIMATVTLAEATLPNLAMALNTTVGATGANFATFDPNYGAFATQVPYFSLLIDGFAPAAVVANSRRRIYLPRCLSTGKITVAYAKDKQTGYNVQLQAFYASSTVPPYHITDQTA